RIAEAALARTTNVADDAARLFLNEGHFYSLQEQHGWALSRFALAYAIECGGRDCSASRRTASLLQTMASEEGDLGEPGRAQATMDKALAVLERTHSKDDPKLGAFFNNLGYMQYKNEDFDAAIGSYRRALAIAEAGLGPDHQWTALALVNLADTLA